MKTIFLFLILKATLILTASAQLEFESKKAVVEATIDDKVVYAYYKFENKGKKDEIISSLDTPCPWCLSGAISGGTKTTKGFVFKPGDKGVIKATFSSLGTFTGSVEKKIHILQPGDTKENPSIKLSCRVNIPKLMTISPAKLAWTTAETGTMKSAIIEIKTPKPIEVKTVSCNGEGFDVKIVELVKGRKYRLEVTTKKGAEPTIGLCYVRTASTHVKYMKMRYYLTID